MSSFSIDFFKVINIFSSSDVNSEDEIVINPTCESSISSLIPNVF